MKQEVIVNGGVVLLAIAVMAICFILSINAGKSSEKPKDVNSHTLKKTFDPEYGVVCYISGFTGEPVSCVQVTNGTTNTNK